MRFDASRRIGTKEIAQFAIARFGLHAAKFADCLAIRADPFLADGPLRNAAELKGYISKLADACILSLHSASNNG
eukprot:SAG31_NODE_690_length_12796_cov_4.634559_2_plen_75_part_00